MDELIKEYHGLIPNKLLDDIKKEINRVKVTKAQLKEIAEKKMPDLNTKDIEQAMKIIAGTARNMGIEIKE